MRDLDINDLARRYLAGEAIEAIAKSVSLTGNGLRHRFVKAGIALEDRKTSAGLFRRKRRIDDQELVRRYQAGESELAISLAMGISRPAVRRRLLDSGIQPRDSSSAASLRLSKMTPDQRLALSDAAHAAVRGIPQSEEHRCDIAITRERRITNVGALEDVLDERLRASGVVTVPQKAIGRYNVDIAITESRIAVEVFGGNWHRSRHAATRYRKRTDYLLDQGWLPIIVWGTWKCSIDPLVTEYIVSLHERRCRGESCGSQEHVIRGDGYVAPIGTTNPYNGAIIVGSQSGKAIRGENGSFR